MSDLAALEGVSPFVLRKAINDLRKCEIVRKIPSPANALQLVRTPSQVVNGQIFACLDNGLMSVREEANPRNLSDIVISELETLLTQKAYTSLKGVTLADVIGEIAKVQCDEEATMFHI